MSIKRLKDGKLNSRGAFKPSVFYDHIIKASAKTRIGNVSEDLKVPRY